MVGNIISEENAKGKLFEDLIGMYLSRYLDGRPGSSLTYDSAEGGADFIVILGGRKIVLEVGAGKKDFKQIINTSKKVSAAYSLVISDNPKIEYSEELNAVKIPLKYFLLI
jgi:hypothetical protein